MRLEYTDRAVSDFIRLRRFIEKHDPSAAKRMAARLLESFSLLKEQPMLGYPVTLAPDPESIRDLIVGNYIIRYSIIHNTILVLRLWHQRESWKE